MLRIESSIRGHCNILTDLWGSAIEGDFRGCLRPAPLLTSEAAARTYGLLLCRHFMRTKLPV